VKVCERFEPDSFITTDKVPGGTEVVFSYSVRLFVHDRAVMREGWLAHLKERLMAVNGDVDEAITLWQKEVS